MMDAEDRPRRTLLDVVIVGLFVIAALLFVAFLETMR